MELFRDETGRKPNHRHVIIHFDAFAEYSITLKADLVRITRQLSYTFSLAHRHRDVSRHVYYTTMMILSATYFKANI